MKLLKRRQFWFVATYPAMLILIFNLKNRLEPWIEERYEYYGFLAFAIAGLVVFFVALDVIMRSVGYGLQGDKLKVRQNQGIEIKDISNGKRD